MPQIQLKDAEIKREVTGTSMRYNPLITKDMLTQSINNAVIGSDAGDLISEVLWNALAALHSGNKDAAIHDISTLMRHLIQHREEHF